MADNLGTGDIIEQVKTKNIDELARKELPFNNAHSAPVYTPSRYSVLSDNHNHHAQLTVGRWGIDGNNHSRKRQFSLAKVLRDKGDYNTNVVGK